MLKQKFFFYVVIVNQFFIVVTLRGGVGILMLQQNKLDISYIPLCLVRFLVTAYGMNKYRLMLMHLTSLSIITKVLILFVSSIVNMVLKWDA